MKSAFLCAAGLLIACLGAHAQSIAEFSSPHSLASQLRGAEESLTAQTAPQWRAALPSAWHVHTAGGDYSISSAPLARLTSDPKNSGAIAEAHSWLLHVSAQLDSFDTPTEQSTHVRSDLAQILARPEFAGDAPPSAWDRFWTRVFAAIGRFFKRLFSFANVHSSASSLLFWLLLTAAVLLMAFFLLRLWTREAQRLRLSGTPLPLPVRDSRQCLLAARAAADDGDFRRAIQCAYWAGVARLQESQALPAANTCTPREYLRLLLAKDENMPRVPPLRTLTSSLERFWYAGHTATPDDFSICLSSLEALGCRVD